MDNQKEQSEHIYYTTDHVVLRIALTLVSLYTLIVGIRIQKPLQDIFYPYCGVTFASSRWIYTLISIMITIPIIAQHAIRDMVVTRYRNNS